MPDDKRYAHHFKFRDEQGGTLVEHGGIWLQELNKFNAQCVSFLNVHSRVLLKTHEISRELLSGNLL